MNVHQPLILSFRTVRACASWLLAATLLLVLAPKQALSQTAAPAADRALSRTPAQVLDGRATLTAPYDPSKMLRLSIGLTPPRMDAERKLLDALHDKKSPQFHKFLSSEEWDARFAPSADDEAAVVAWAKSEGMTVTNRFADRLLVDVEAPAGVIEKAFNIKINSYKMGAETYFANDRDPQLPAGLTHTVQSVIGLNSFLRLRPAIAGMKPQVARPDYTAGPAVATGERKQAEGSQEKLTAALAKSRATAAARTAGGVPNGVNGYYDPTDIYSSQAYNFNGLYAQGHCCNPTGGSVSPAESTIAIAAFAHLNYDDVAAFQKQYSYLSYNIQQRFIDGTYTCNDQPGNPDEGCLEVTLDTEWSLSMANSFGSSADTAKVWVYEGANYGDIADVYNQMVTDSYAKVTSTSWGCEEFACFDGPTMDSLDAIFAKMVGQGWTLIAATGDQGATAGCGDAVAVQFPSSDPNFVGAGGTTLELYDGPVYASEVGWQGNTNTGACSKNGGGSTGGFSSHFGAPGYQGFLGYGSRAIPDIALNANVGQNMYYAPAGGLFGVGGTSIVAPELAGFFAQENAYELSVGSVCGSSGTAPCAPIGNANYYMYAEQQYKQAAHYPYYDITSGCNSNDITALYSLNYYCAGSGYDEVTGIGSANMLQLAWAINWYDARANGGPSVSFTGPAINTWYNTSQTVSWSIVDNIGSAGGTGTGIAGFTQGWDSIPGDAYTQTTPGAGDSFYTGPEFPNGSEGCLQTGNANGCQGNVSQGCHTAYVRGWNNMGVTTGQQGYGPICYDTVAPTAADTLTGTVNGSVYISSVKATLTASDATSGVKAIYYELDGGNLTTYTGPLTISATGTHNIYFYSLDVAGNYSAVQHPYFTIESPTATSVVSSVNPLIYGNSTTLTASVSATFGGAAAGTVTFKSGSTVLGTATLASGKAALSVSTGLLVGSNSISAVYAGNTNDESSASSALVETVKQAGSSTALSASASTTLYESPVSFTATVKPSTAGTPSGSVTFKNGTAVLGTVALSSGKAVYTTSSLTLGAHSITAVYNGSSGYAGSTSSTVSHTVQQDSTSTTVSSSANPSYYDAPLTFTVAVNSGNGVTPSGTVTLKNGSATVGTANLSGGKAVFKTTSLATGTFKYTAVYAGDTQFAGSTSSVLTQVEKPAVTTATISSSLNPATFDKAVTFTALVKPGTTGTPTGSVTFKNGSAVLGTVTLSSGKAEYTTSALTIGNHAITATYNGDAHYASDVSPVLTESVNKATTSTEVVSSLNPSTSGKQVSFTATAASTAGVPSGSITFKDGSSTLGTVVLSGGKAVFNTATLTVGSHSITATYNGGGNFIASTSSALTESVKQATTATTLASSLNPSTSGTAVKFTATVTSSGGTPTGAVSFMDGSVKLGSVNLSGGKAVFTTSSLAVKTHSIQAIYAGATDFVTSKSAVLSQKVNP